MTSLEPSSSTCRPPLEADQDLNYVMTDAHMAKFHDEWCGRTRWFTFAHMKGLDIEELFDTLTEDVWSNGCAGAR